MLMNRRRWWLLSCEQSHASRRDLMTFLATNMSRVVIRSVPPLKRRPPRNVS